MSAQQGSWLGLAKWSAQLERNLSHLSETINLGTTSTIVLKD